jgi:hypothetical protein
LVVASVSNNNALSFNDKPSSTFQLVVASVTNEFSKGKRSMNNSRQNGSFVDNVLMNNSRQCRSFVDNESIGNHASTQLVSSCHDKKSERVGNCASTQLVGSCHNKTSEQAGCIASTQHDSIFQLIAGFNADLDFSDI